MDRWPKAVTITAIESGAPQLVEARSVIAAFHAMIRKKNEAELDAWIDLAKASLVASLANGVMKDRTAVRAAIISPGPTDRPKDRSQSSNS